MIRLFASNETDFTHNRYILKDTTICEPTETENGVFDLTLEYPVNPDIQEEAIIKAPTPRGEQLFVIETITKTLKGYRAYAVDYISYKLRKNFLEDVRPTGLNCEDATNYMLQRTASPVPFTATSDIADMNTAYYVRTNPLQALIGAENSILNNYGGYLVRNGMNIHIMKEPKDIGYEIRLGKNLIGVEQNIDLTNVFTRLYPTAVLGDNTIAVLPEKYVDSPYVLNYEEPMFKDFPVTLTTEEKLLSTPAIREIMRARAQAEFAKGIDLPSINYKVDFVQLEKIARIPHSGSGLAASTHEELSADTHTELSLKVHGVAFGDPTDVLKKMNELDISHMVSVYVPKLGIYVKARIIKYVYDSLTQRFKSIELGDYKPMEQYMTNNIVLNMNRNLKLKANQTSIDTPTHILTENGFELRDGSGGLLVNKYGSVNMDNFGKSGNVEEGFPLWIPFEIDTDVSSIKKVSLWWKNYPFRADAKSAAGGGGGAKTSEIGGAVSQTKTSSSGGSALGYTSDGEGWTGESGTVYGDLNTQTGGKVQKHSHWLNWLHSHTIDIVIAAHAHTLTLLDHVHNLIFGIVETPITDDTIIIFIDGTERATVNARTGKIDITQWITSVGDHEIELRSTTMKLIHANVALKTYIRG